MPISRRELLAAAAATSLSSIPVLSAAQDKPVPPPLNPDLVRDFVIAAHKSLDALKPLLEETPALLNATIDWRAGDFESAIGGAGHMGHRDIAQFLIEKGARTDLFVHTMLGHTDVVRPILTRYPQMVECKGPHGISLARHAEAGGEPAKELLDYIKSLIRSATL